MNTFRKFLFIIMALVIAIGMSSCSNNEEIVKEMILEYNEDAGLEIDNIGTVLEAELDGKDIIFPIQIHSANFNNVSQADIDEFGNSDLAGLLFSICLDGFSKKEANAIINGKYNIVFQYIDDDNNYIEFPIENSDLKEYFE